MASRSSTLMMTIASLNRNGAETSPIARREACVLDRFRQVAGLVRTEVTAVLAAGAVLGKALGERRERNGPTVNVDARARGRDDAVRELFFGGYRLRRRGGRNLQHDPGEPVSEAATAPSWRGARTSP